MPDKQHKFKAVILAGKHGWECEDCGYKEIAMYFGKTPSCKEKLVTKVVKGLSQT